MSTPHPHDQPGYGPPTGQPHPPAGAGYAPAPGAGPGPYAPDGGQGPGAPVAPGHGDPHGLRYGADHGGAARQDPYGGQRDGHQGGQYGAPGHRTPYRGDAPAPGHAGPGYGPAGGPTPAVPAPEAEEPPLAPGTVRRVGSPIRPPGIRPAAITALFGALIAVSAPFGLYALLPVVVVLQAVTAAGWFRLNGMWPARQGILLAFAAGLAADVVLILAPAGEAAGALAGTLGVWFLLVIVLQLRHHGEGDDRLASLTATAASALLAVVAGGLLAAVTVNRTAVVAVAVAVAVAALSRAALTVPWVSPVVALALATGAGAGVGHWAQALPEGALLGAAAGVCALTGLRVASYDWPSRFVHFTAGVALPMTAAAPAAYLLARALF
ncbi:hypothetical protein [Streptomyces spiramenti]|uniref:Integral membrane protein n=1 Tax=Streptomyces spiramenti TaxID=2720606 RepID=A0ABX1AN82_9ACTN|nr:hypothetical protein [Streptomyces spiramenti]NJP67735.1 hypothetical protein [Streptomyces spiramenti]